MLLAGGCIAFTHRNGKRVIGVVATEVFGNGGSIGQSYERRIVVIEVADSKLESERSLQRETRFCVLASNIPALHPL